MQILVKMFFLLYVGSLQSWPLISYQKLNFSFHVDYLSEDPQARDAETKKNCLCNGPSCICCLDFNMSFIDLGGPGILIFFIKSENLLQHIVD